MDGEAPIAYPPALLLLLLLQWWWSCGRLAGLAGARWAAWRLTCGRLCRGATSGARSGTGPQRTCNCASGAPARYLSLRLPSSLLAGISS